jgi:very-short-patch-repair endonuclease
VRFHVHRRWRLDLGYRAQRIGVEIMGGTYSHGRHVRGVGYREDCEKSNEALVLGWRILRFTGDQVTDGTALQTLERVLAPPQLTEDGGDEW